MAENLVKICTARGCPKYSSPGERELEAAVAFVESNGDAVEFTDRCPDVCNMLGARDIGGVSIGSQIALCVVAGDAYRVPVGSIDYMGFSAVIGRTEDGDMKLALLNQKPYPREA